MVLVYTYKKQVSIFKKIQKVLKNFEIFNNISLKNWYVFTWFVKMKFLNSLILYRFL